MFHDKQNIGNVGEEIASMYLLGKRYKILYRNFKQGRDEIDIIAKDPLSTLVFIEVKTMRQTNSAIAELKPEDNLTKSKLNKLKRSAQMFAGKHSELINERSGWRIDLVAICLTLNNHSLRHYENI